MVIEAHRAVWPEIVSIPRLRRKARLDSVHSTSCDHVSFAIDYQVDFFRGLVMMGEVSSTRGEIHPEKTGDDVRVINRITLSISWASQQLV